MYYFKLFIWSIIRSYAYEYDYLLSVQFVYLVYE